MIDTNTRSIHNDTLLNYRTRIGRFMKTHGLTRTPTYNSWQQMKRRCNDVNDPTYLRYGAVGITYDPRWEIFEEFLQDMGFRPEGMTLDRFPNNRGNYCKENCRWATPRQQNLNRRSNTIMPGVYWRKHSGCKKTGGRWEAKVKTGKTRLLLYAGQDYFEAICIMKSYNNKDK